MRALLKEPLPESLLVPLLAEPVLQKLPCCCRSRGSLLFRFHRVFARTRARGLTSSPTLRLLPLLWLWLPLPQ